MSRSRIPALIVARFRKYYVQTNTYSTEAPPHEEFFNEEAEAHLHALKHIRDNPLFNTLNPEVLDELTLAMRRNKYLEVYEIWNSWCQMEGQYNFRVYVGEIT